MYLDIYICVCVCPIFGMWQLMVSYKEHVYAYVFAHAYVSIF